MQERREHGEVYKAILPYILEAGRMMLDRSDLAVSQKAANDFVTQKDKAIQAYLLRSLGPLFPGAVFIAEEKENPEIPMGETLIIDPIDGTTNFINGFPVCAVCLAYAVDREVECSFVYNPFLQELFSAERGKGAWLNDREIHTIHRPLDRSICLIGDSWKGDKDTLRRYFASCRMIGSAELQICQVACGRAQADITKSIHVWDYAAGMLIAEEAGALVLDPEGKRAPLKEPGTIMVCTSESRDQVLAIWHESMKNRPWN